MLGVQELLALTLGFSYKSKAILKLSLFKI